MWLCVKYNEISFASALNRNVFLIYPLENLIEVISYPFFINLIFTDKVYTFETSRSLEISELVHTNKKIYEKTLQIIKRKQDTNSSANF